MEFAGGQRVRAHYESERATATFRKADTAFRAAGTQLKKVAKGG